jgi:ParB family chromosome partitioning protein
MAMGGADAARLSAIPLARLHVPASNVRTDSRPAAAAALASSLRTHGVLVPIIVRPSGDEWEVLDGGRRVRTLRAIDVPGSSLVPAIVFACDDAAGLVTQVHVNQVRERLTALAEAETLRRLVRDSRRSAADAARLLGKSRSWGSRVLRVFDLPAQIVADLRADRLGIAQATTLVDFAAEPAALAVLHVRALGGASKHELAEVGRQLRRGRVAAPPLPGRLPIGPHSWLRLAASPGGRRLVIHLDARDDPAATLDRAANTVRDIMAASLREDAA